MKQKMQAYFEELEEKFRKQQLNEFPDKLELGIGPDKRLVTVETYKVGAVMPPARNTATQGGGGR